MEHSFRAGVGRQDISPKVGGQLYGYVPTRPSTSLHDPLHVTVFAFEQDGLTVLLGSVDLCGFPDALCLRVRTAIHDATGVPVEHIVLCAIHTHSGPVVTCDENGYPHDAENMLGVFLPGAVRAAQEALAALEPAELGIGVTMSNVGINRRKLREDGRIVLAQDELGLYDPRMTVVSVRSRQTGAVLGNMVHYGCHNTASGQNSEITRDWCGVMIDRMDAETGGKSAFFNGCQGDCGPRLPNGKTTGNLQMALELGGIAGIDAMRAWRSIREWRDEIDLRTLTGIVEVPYDELPPLEELEARLVNFPEPETLKGSKKEEYDGLCGQIAFLKSGERFDKTRKINMSLIALGPIVFVPIPYETFSSITMRITRHSPFPYTVCCSYGNGSNGYFPSQDQICRGGYEVLAFKRFRVHPLADNADQYLISGALALLRQLYEQEKEQ